MSWRRFAVLLLATLLIAVFSKTLRIVVSAGTTEKQLERVVTLVGAGTSFPDSFYHNWFIELNRKIPELRVNYASVGTGAGIEQFLVELTDFSARDIAMRDEDIAVASRGIVMLPMTAGAVVLIYNLPGVDALNLTRDAYVNILLGNITRWHDPAIADANSNLTLPDQPITVVHRADGTRLPRVLTQHLSAVSQAWANSVGEGTRVEWPRLENFVSNKRNLGVATQVQAIEGSIGYVDYGYAINNGLRMAALENASGNFVPPNAETLTATLAATELPENLRAFIVDPEGPDSYPVVAYTWILAHQTYADPDKAQAIEMMVEYGLNEGQAIAPQLGYVALPANVRDRVAAAADVISSEVTSTMAAEANY
ncbi:MAG: phosphate ABC transporter substrate-binding protein PstS [Cyanobacteria bacterium J06636_16]